MLVGTLISVRPFSGEPPSLAAPAPQVAQYYLLEDHYVNNNEILAGTIVAAGLDVPTNWIPSSNVDPLNTLAVTALYSLGPRPLGLIRQQWAQIGIRAPVTYWRQIGSDFWQLTGLGASLAPIHGATGSNP